MASRCSTGGAAEWVHALRMRKHGPPQSAAPPASCSWIRLSMFRWFSPSARVVPMFRWFCPLDDWHLVHVCPLQVVPPLGSSARMTENGLVRILPGRERDW